jgi:hypothetical protein
VTSLQVTGPLLLNLLVIRLYNTSFDGEVLWLMVLGVCLEMGDMKDETPLLDVPPTLWDLDFYSYLERQCG